MKAFLRLSLLAIVTLAPAVQAGECYRHHDRTYVGLYHNPAPTREYRETYAGHYVRKERPYRFATMYERITYPRNYSTGGPYRWPDRADPTITVSLRRPGGYCPCPYHSTYHVPMR